MPYTPLRDARTCVLRKEEFTGNNVYAKRIGPLYAVFSYRDTWPLFIYGAGFWFINQDKYSRTTSKHHGMLCPSTNTRKLPVSEMVDLLNPHTHSGATLRMLAEVCDE